MDEDDNRRQRRRIQTLASKRDGGGREEKAEKENIEEDGDSPVWGALDKKLREVQSVLDRNRALIQQVNDNHESKISENMAKNVSLIREINDNVSRVVLMYSDLGADLSRALHHQRRAEANPNSSN